jgi:hypothetical protein
MVLSEALERLGFENPGKAQAPLIKVECGLVNW